MLLTVIGQGYIGLPVSVAFAAAGHTVYAAESAPDRHQALARGDSYIPDVPSGELRARLDSGLLRPVRDARLAPGSDVYIIATPTPLTPAREPDLRLVEEALTAIAATARPGALIVLESTVYPGALRRHIAPFFERLTRLRSGEDVHFAYSPERVDPGRDLPLRVVPKLVSGLDHRAVKLARELYETAFDVVVEVSSSEVAEFAKLYENTFRYVNVAFVNELSKAAHAMAVPFREVVSAAASKPYGFMSFHHGPGVGGHCLPNNIHYLNHAMSAAGHPSEMLAVAERINLSMPGYAVERLRQGLMRHGTPLSGARVLVLGRAFKAGVSDTRNSPAHTVIRLLTDAGTHVRVADPLAGTDHAEGTRFTPVELTREECRAADAVMLVTDHAGVDSRMVLESSGLILDCRGWFKEPEVEQL
ncbi:nucleotide sugar dehydrogenase [Streptomyces sp. NPDC091377]|uniref:nucleotide sugar dehydrogenase n=1 Tax=Streptomyces sp. NPDC091377 TaxID=3365995 RepID=UPI00380EBC47